MTELVADPATIVAALKAAQDNATIRLTPGDYGLITLPGRAWSAPITIDAGDPSGDCATGSLLINGCAGVTVRGGRWHGIGTQNPGGNAVRISFSKRIKLDGADIADATNGIVARVCDDLELTYNELRNFTADAIDVISCRRALIESNRAHSAIMTPPAHPDFIQGWHEKGQQLLEAVIVRKNVLGGKAQGISFYNNTPGTAGLPLVGIVIEDNWIAANSANGIVLNGAINAIVARNTLSPDASLPKGWRVTIQADAVTRATWQEADNMILSTIEAMPARPARPAPVPPPVVVPPVPDPVPPPVVVPPVPVPPVPDVPPGPPLLPTPAVIEALRRDWLALVNRQCDMLAVMVA